jgi:Ras GTPase-activating-like protein IQGAP2/3
MVLAYNKRKQGSEYLKTTLAPLIQQVVKQQDIMLDMRPTGVHQWLINEKEIRTGEKSTLDRNLPEDKILELPEVTAVLKTRAEQLIGTAKQFLDALINSLPRLPYGLRWICKQIQQIAAENFPQSTQADILRVTGYLVYYRFINLMIVTPMEFKVVDVRDLNVNTTKNLVAVAKVLQQLFYLSTFTEKYMQPVNEWITANMDRARQYLENLLDVPDPEDFLKVDKYIELTQKTKPVIIISYHEVSQTHNLVHKHLDSLSLEKDDPLRIIMKELAALGPIPDIPKDDDREVQLTLTNRFETHVEEDLNPDKQLFSETKELAIKALSGIPVEPRPEGGGPPVLSDTLQRGLAHADKTGNSPLHVTITKTLENLKKLEEKGLITAADNYASFLREVALEVANRQAIREQQKKEVRRLTATVKNLQTIQQYMNEQIRQYNDYLEACKEQHYQGKKKKKSKKQNSEEKVKPTKYSYKQLKGKGIIVSVDESLESVIKKLDFVISSKKAGSFNVVARLGPAEAKNVRVEMDELLECQANGITSIDREGIVLDVNMMLHLLNKMLVK